MVSISVNPTAARVELMLMPADCTVFPANPAPVGLQYTNSSSISFGGHSSELTFLLPRSLQVLFEGMEGVQMVLHWCHGKAGAALRGTLRSLIHWQFPTFKLMARLIRPVQLLQQLLVSTSSTTLFRPHISSYLSRLRLSDHFVMKV